jgi:FkbM family methyltransferase
VYYFLKYYPPLHKLRLKILNPSLSGLMKAENKLFEKVLPSGRLRFVIDGGANVGHLTSYFASRSDKVIAIEPVPQNAEELRGRFRGNQRIVILERILDCEKGQKELFISDDKDHTVSTVNEGWSEWWKQQTGLQKIQYQEKRFVPTVTLPELFEQYGVPDLLKLDIEGNEWRALSLLQHPVKVISFETHLPDFMDDTIKIIQHLYGLSDGIVFNASINDEDLALPGFIPPPEFVAWLKQSGIGYAQIFCKVQADVKNVA